MKRLLLFFNFLLLSLISYAQTEVSKQKSSLIVALDVRAPRVNGAPFWNSNSVSDAILGITREHNVAPDLVSGVLYGVREGALSPKDFSKLIVKPRPATNGYSDLLNSLHSQLPIGSFFSITSFAKPYSLIALKDMALTNRTFMAIITDGKYNGNDDYYGEVSFVRNNFSQEGKNEFKKSIKNVQTNYFCEYLGSKSIIGGYVQLYEFIPVQQYFALESVLDFPHEIIAERKKSSYSVKFATDAIQNKDYEIQKLVLSLYNGDKIISSQEIHANQEIELQISKSEINNVHIEIDSWVKLCDEIYNNTVLHPKGSKLQGSEGLTRRVVIKKEKDASILGIVPLPDFLFSISFWTSSQTTAANTWAWIIIFILIAIVVYIIYRSNIYKPIANEIKI